MTDYISRADAKQAVYLLGKRPQINEIWDCLDALPSADAVDVAHDIPEYCSWSQTYTNMVQSAMSKASADAVQGEWIEKGGELVCSVCGNSVSFSRTPKGWVLGKFCQSCGTRMKGGDTE